MTLSLELKKNLTNFNIKSADSILKLFINHSKSLQDPNSHELLLLIAITN